MNKLNLKQANKLNYLWLNKNNKLKSPIQKNSKKFIKIPPKKKISNKIKWINNFSNNPIFFNAYFKIINNARNLMPNNSLESKKIKINFEQ